MLVRSTGARSIVEFGTSFGISTLHFAAGLRDNGGGRVITTEFEPSKAARARENFVAGGLADLIELREGDALETLAHELPDEIDVVLLDGAKGLYLPVLELLEDHLRPGTMIVADNADRTPQYLDVVRSADRGYMSVPFADDVELSMRTADSGHEHGALARPVDAGPDDFDLRQRLRGRLQRDPAGGDLINEGWKLGQHGIDLFPSVDAD